MKDCQSPKEVGLRMREYIIQLHSNARDWIRVLHRQQTLGGKHMGSLTYRANIFHVFKIKLILF